MVAKAAGAAVWTRKRRSTSFQGTSPRRRRSWGRGRLYVFIQSTLYNAAPAGAPGASTPTACRKPFCHIAALGSVLRRVAFKLEVTRLLEPLVETDLPVKLERIARIGLGQVALHWLLSL